MTTDPIRDWYEGKRREAEALQGALDLAKKEDAPPEAIRLLERRLEWARYVGD